MRKEEVKAIRNYAKKHQITDPLSLFPDERPPIDKQGFQYVKITSKSLPTLPGYSVYRKVKVT